MTSPETCTVITPSSRVGVGAPIRGAGCGADCWYQRPAPSAARTRAATAIQVRLGGLEAAFDTYEELALLAPDDPWPRVQQGWILREQGDPVGAEAAFLGFSGIEVGGRIM